MFDRSLFNPDATIEILHLQDRYPGKDNTYKIILTEDDKLITKEYVSKAQVDMVIAMKNIGLTKKQMADLMIHIEYLYESTYELACEDISLNEAGPDL